ncbi:hypothetical protein FO519_010349, partial [Halicephalobus sp. NKZ332]
FQGIKGSPPALARGQSLFSSIRKDRTCFEAEIPKNFCPCSREVILDPSEGVEYAEILLNYIRDYFRKHEVKDKCASMELDSVKSLSVSVPPMKLVLNTNEADLKNLVFTYRIQFTVKAPSKALLEGVIYKNKITGDVSTAPDIERNNKYGNTSICVQDQLLKKLCHCI